MSHELFELFGMLGFGVALTAFFHRTLQPVLLRLAAFPRRRAADDLDPDPGSPSGASVRGCGPLI